MDRLHQEANASQIDKAIADNMKEKQAYHGMIESSNTVLTCSQNR